MKGSLKVGSVAGIDVRLHWSLVFLVLLVGASYPNLSLIGLEAMWLAAVFVSVFVHEIAHSVVARHRGYVVRDIVIMPFGGVSEIFGISDSPRDEVVISLAGPLMSWAIAGVLLLVALGFRSALWPPTLFGRGWPVRLMWANLLLGAFNLLPALPLDGGRVLRGLLSRTRDRRSATVLAVRFSRAIAIGMVLAGILVDFWLSVIGVIVLLGANAEANSLEVVDLVEGLKVRDEMVDAASGLQADEPLADVAPVVRAASARAFPVLEGDRVVGIVEAGDVGKGRPGALLRDVVDTRIPHLEANDDLYPKAFDAFAESGRTALVVEDHGRLVGVLYQSDVELVVRSRLARRGRE